MIKLILYVQPGAKVAGLAGWYGALPKLKVAAPPEDGKANEEVIEFLSKYLGVPKRNIDIVQGHLSRKKVLMIQGLTELPSDLWQH
jgi:uncharacterized protein (TIGR00251 family)